MPFCASLLRRRGLAVAAVIAMAAPAGAQDIAPALRGGQADLALFALSRTEPEISPLGEALLRLQGFRHDPDGPLLQTLSRGMALMPTLRHDNNVNGGIPGRHLTIGDYRFEVTEDSRSIGAMLYGLQFAGWHSLSWGPGARLRLQHGYLAEFEPEHGYDHFAASARACAEQPVARWTWMDLCLGGLVEDDGIGTDHSLTGTLGLRRMVETPAGFAQIGAQLGQLVTEDYAKPLARIEATVLTPRSGLLSARLDFGARVDGENTLRRMATLGWTGSLAGQDLSLTLARAESDGAQLFGMPRADTIDRATLTLHRPNFDVGFYAETRRSTLDAFNEEDFGITVAFRTDILAWLRR